MSNFRDVLITQVAQIIQSEMIFVAGNRGDLTKLAEDIVDGLFADNDNWEAIQEHLNERVIAELPPMDANGKLR